MDRQAAGIDCEGGSDSVSKRSNGSTTEAIEGVSTIDDVLSDEEPRRPCETSEDDEGCDVEDSGELTERSTGDQAEPQSSADVRYTADLSDEELARRWREDITTLGSISVGFTDEGRLINAAQFPKGDGKAWRVVLPSASWATSETIEAIVAAAHRVKELHPDAPPLRVNALSLEEGGWLRPHKTHQSGRDVDLGFYYATDEARRCRACEKHINVAANWDLVKALVVLTDVQVILVDRRIQDMLYAHALSIGEDRAWLDSIFNRGEASLVKHARRHRDHFHVRFYNPRAQELGRRVTPLLAERPDQNLRMVRIRQGDNLGRIALRNKSSVGAIMKANRMRSTFLRVGRILRVPMRGPCTKCPVPPPLEVPPRRLPPMTESEPTTASITGPPLDVAGSTAPSTAGATEAFVGEEQPSGS